MKRRIEIGLGNKIIQGEAIIAARNKKVEVLTIFGRRERAEEGWGFENLSGINDRAWGFRLPIARGAQLLRDHTANGRKTILLFILLKLITHLF